MTKRKPKNKKTPSKKVTDFSKVINLPGRPLQEKTVEATIVETVLNERNLIVTDVSSLLPEGVTPQDILEDFLAGNELRGQAQPQTDAQRAIIAAANAGMREAQELAAYKPSSAVQKFVDENGISEETVEALKNAKPWTIFNIGGKSMMKTPDNKIEEVQSYCFRLEQAVLNISRARDTDNKYWKEAVYKLRKQLETPPRYTIQAKVKDLGLRLKTVFGKLRVQVVKLISREN
jgi:hypothetical protein